MRSRILDSDPIVLGYESKALSTRHPQYLAKVRCHIVASHRLGNKNQPKGFPVSGFAHYCQCWNVRLSGAQARLRVVVLGFRHGKVGNVCPFVVYLMVGGPHDHLHPPNGSKPKSHIHIAHISAHLLWVSHDFIYQVCVQLLIQLLRSQFNSRRCTRPQ